MSRGKSGERPAPERRYGERLLSWAPRLLAAAAILTAADVIHMLAFFPPAASDLPGFAAYGAHSLAVFCLYGAPLVALGAALEPRLARLRLPDPADLAVLVLAVLAVALGARLTDTNFFHGQHIQFPRRVDILRDAATVGLLVVVAAAALLVARPLARRLFALLPNLSAPRVVPVAAIAALVITGIWTADFGLVAVHLDPLSGLAGFACLALTLVAVRLAWTAVGRRPARVGLALAAALVVALPLGPWRSPHGLYLLYGHAPLAGSMAALFRDAADLDGDGASPSWLGGADCAELDPSIGPSLREVAGDGVDQDCRGGDAPRAEPTSAPPPLPLGECELDGTRRSVVLITVDALRTDAVTPEVAPRLFDLARRSNAFVRAYTAATVTHLSFPTLLDSAALSDLASPNPIDEKLVCATEPLAERFRRGGWHTGYVNYLIERSELARGFDAVNPRSSVPDLGPGMLFDELRAARVTNDGLAYVAARGGEPYFLWMHYLDPHAPYLRPEGAGFDDVIDPDYRHRGDDPLVDYRRVVSYVDFHIGRFLAGARAGASAPPAIVISADHGEDLGLRGREGHGPDVFEDTASVPLLIWVPGCPPRVVEEPVSVTRVGPTIRALAGLEAPPREARAPVPVVSEGLYTGGSFSARRFRRAVVGERYKLIVDVLNGGKLLFDMEGDPSETRSVYGGAAAKEAEETYQRWLDRGPRTGIGPCGQRGRSEE